MRRQISKGIVSVADQASISVSSLAVNLALVRGASKEDYGLFTLVIAAILLAQSVQNALVLSPLTSLAAQPDAKARDAVIGVAFRGQMILAAICGVVATVAVMVADGLGLSAFGAPIAIAVGIALTGTLLREALRAAQYIRHREAEALGADVAYLALVALFLAYAWVSHGLTATTALLATGASAMLTSVSGILLLFRQIPAPRQTLRAVSVDLWAMGRWALPSVLSTWVYTNGYAYLINAYMGAAAVAEVSAARLFTVPVTLLVTAWSSVARPHLSASHKSGGGPQSLRFLLASVAALIAVGLAYYAAIALAYPQLQSAMGAKYANIGPLVVAWGCVTIFVGVRSIGMAAVLSVPAGFRQMFVFGLPTMVAGLVIALVGSMQGSGVVVIMGLAVAELILLSLVWPAALRTLRGVRAAKGGR